MDHSRTILSIQPGDVLVGRYTLIEWVGRGTMGEVWKAEDRETGRVYALKLLPTEFIGSDAADKRMKAEAAIGQDLSHDSIVRLYTYERDPARGNVSFLVMEFVEGRTLQDILEADGPQPLDRVLGWAKDLAAGIDYAHAKKVLHRDIKPGNVMIETATGRARLLDFGIGREIRNTMSQVSMRADSSGTLAYMSPQHVMGENDKSNDVYSLAATLYHALSGKPPFTDGHIQTQILHKPAPPIPGLPEHVNTALLSGLAKAVGERAASAQGLEQAMTCPPKKPPEPSPVPPARPAPDRAGDRETRRASRGWQAAAVIALVVVGVAIGVYQNNQARSSAEARQGEAARLAEERRQADARAAAVAHLTEAARLAEERRQADARAEAVARLTEAARLAEERQRADVRAANAARQREEVATRQGPPASSSPSHLDRRTVELAPGVTAEFVFIDAPDVAPDGFLMGSPASEEGRNDDEGQHLVKLTRGYWMQTTEVTQGQWAAVMGSNPSRRKSGANYPVETVSWEDCQQFIAKLRQRGISARLPTEAEWEFACRAGTTTAYAWGNDSNDASARFWANGNDLTSKRTNNFPWTHFTWDDGYQHTAPVGSDRPGARANAWGLYDMHGNVWEWCQDWYGDFPAGTATDPTGPQTGSYRVLRGGSWGTNPGNLRSANRSWHSPTYRGNYYGFRLTLESE